MYLRKIANRFARQAWEEFDEDSQTFVPSDVRGSLTAVDRFIPNYNLPTRRRLFHHDPDMTFPDSRVIRSVDTGDVYALGIARYDSNAVESNYHGLTLVHMMTDQEGDSSGLATFHRRVAKGPANDPGWLEDTILRRTYVDLEFRTSENVEGAYEMQILNFFIRMPIVVDLNTNDFVELHGTTYRVIETYPDTGFTVARADKREDPRINFIVQHNDRRYDPDKMRYVDDVTEYKVTGELVAGYEFGMWLSDSQDYIDVVVYKENIGIVPQTGHFIVFGGRKREITRVSTQSGEKQYRMRCA